MRKNLVLARVGPKSLHRSWLEGSGARNWDLRLAPYRPMCEPLGGDCVIGEVVPGAKWSGLRDVLRSWHEWRAYDYIWFPDDDVSASAEVINRMFEVAHALGLDLFAPALDEYSYYAHYSVMRNRSFFGRWVGFVEIMVPAFRVRVLEKLLFTLDLGDTGWGWGLDSVWPKLLGYKNIAILDGLAVSHTRPVGQLRDTELQRRLLEESDRLLDLYQCRQTHATFGAFDEHLQPLELSPEELLLDLVRGWQYLIDGNPRVLSWIMDFQRPHFDWPEYPGAGSPGQGIRRPCEVRAYDPPVRLGSADAQAPATS